MLRTLESGLERAEPARRPVLRARTDPGLPLLADPVALGRASTAQASGSILQLQSTVGNRSVVRLLQRQSLKQGSAASCGEYQQGEITRSRSSGILAHDVRSPLPGELLVVSDFGVGQSEVKDESWREPLFLEWRSILENEPSRTLQLAGYSDCVGGSKRNAALREARAVSIARLFVPAARERIQITNTASPRRFLTPDNLTPEHRAMNRAVLIGIKPPLNRDIDAAAERVTADTLPKKVDHLLRAVETKRPNNDWLRCVVKNLRHNKNFDDRVIDGWEWFKNVDRIVEPLTPETAADRGLVVHLREWVQENIQPSDDPDMSKAEQSLQELEDRFLESTKRVRADLDRRYTQGGWDSAAIGDRQLSLTFDALAKKSQGRRAFKLPLKPGGITIIPAKGKESPYSCDK